MPSSTSSSDPASWRRFFRAAVGAIAVVGGLLYLFIVLVDPFDALPLSWPASRAPIATNARFSFPALARKQRFDSAVIGTSSSRLLKPGLLDQAFGGRFANLAMNAATAYEQARLLDVFLAAHPAPRTVIIGLDDVWCLARTLQRTTPRPFPEWMYNTDRWDGYREVFNLYTLEQAGIQFVTLLGLKREEYGRDGYTSFVPDDRLYDPARVALHLRQAGAALPDTPPHADPASLPYPPLDLLRAALARIPAGTRVVLFFAPLNHVLQPASGGVHDEWQECKRRVVGLAGPRANTLIVDFMIASPITDADDNYWDSVHYRVGIADRLVRDLAAASRGEASPAGDYRVLTPAR